MDVVCHPTPVVATLLAGLGTGAPSTHTREQDIGEDEFCDTAFWTRRHHRNERPDLEQGTVCFWMKPSRSSGLRPSGKSVAAAEAVGISQRRRLAKSTKNLASAVKAAAIFPFATWIPASLTSHSYVLR